MAVLLVANSFLTITLSLIPYENFWTETSELQITKSRLLGCVLSPTIFDKPVKVRIMKANQTNPDPHPAVAGG
jgi:hypothetical protein